VLLYQNTLSSNPVAHRVGDAVGGSEGVRRYLVEELGLPPDTVRLETTSGLGDNAMTARGIFAVLRELDRELARQNLKPHDILPVADERRSTLDTRLQGSGLENAISGKTGTLSAADGGVGMASLAGYINTTSGERLAFVLMDEGPSFHLHRQLQHDFLLDALTGRIDPQPVEIERPRDPLPGSALEIEERADLPRVPSKNRATRSRL
jgi:serine-type D-Ala-D-Ala carboxypeptidase/endopeptidase (penicillin-binding protein 4)